MAIPFKADHFRFRRQAELEKELHANNLFRKIDASTGNEWSRQEILLKMAGGFQVPPGVMTAIEEATLTLKTVAWLDQRRLWKTPRLHETLPLRNELSAALRSRGLPGEKSVCTMPPWQ